MTQKHTPGNWTATNSNNSDYWDIDGECRICSIDIQALIQADGNREEAEANAQRIVTCVNNFDKIAFDLQCAATDNLELKATNDALVIALKDLVRYSELLATKSHASKHAPIYEAKQLLNNINQK